jgi:glycine hydroxymethyltransferase
MLDESQLAFGWSTTGERLTRLVAVRLGHPSWKSLTGTIQTSYTSAASAAMPICPCPRKKSLPMTDRQPSTFNQPLEVVDPEIAEVLKLELGRQRDYLEMIASENFVPRAILESQGSVLTNKYTEGYPGRRYYGGCEFVDIAENLAIERAKKLFGADFANVQPHSGAQANAAVLAAIATPGDTILGLELSHGGHLTHGMKLNFSGKLYNAVAYEVDPTTYLIDMEIVRKQALEHKPKVIIAGWSAYPRQLDFAAFRAIADEVGAYLWVDMAHFAGLVAAGLHPSPLPHAHVVSSTVHKTLAGPRSGVILSNEESLFKKLNSAVFPGQQGGPLMHVIAAKATAFKLAAEPEFKDRQERTIRGAQLLAKRLTAPDAKAAGIDVLTGGTDVHLVLVDLRSSEVDGKQAENLLHEVGITVNRNSVPWDPRPPMVTSGVRIGTPALATRGFGDEEFTEVADIIASALMPNPDIAALAARVKVLTDAFPLYA